MSGKKVSGLPAYTSAQSADVIYAVTESSSKRITGGNFIKTVPVSAAGPTTPRPLTQRFGERIRVLDYIDSGQVQAILDGDVASQNATTVTTGINDAITEFKTRFDTIDSETVRPATLEFAPGIYAVNGDGIDLTSIRQRNWTVEGCGAIIFGQTTGKAVVDMIFSRDANIKDLFIFGDSSNQPTVGLQWGRKDSSTAGRHRFNNVSVRGSFSKAAGYNLAAEICSYLHCEFWNDDSNSTSYALYMDGVNDFSITSAHQTISGGPFSFNENLFLQADCRKPNGGIPLYINRGNRHRFFDTYLLSDDSAAVELNQTSANAIRDLTLDVHCESENGTPGITDCVTFTGDATQTLRGLTFRDHSPHASDAIFEAGSGVTSVSIERLDLYIPDRTLTPTLFQPKENFVVDGITGYIGDGAMIDNIDRMMGILYVDDKANVTGYGDGTVMVFDQANDHASFKGELRIHDGSGTDTAGSSLGNTLGTTIINGQRVSTSLISHGIGDELTISGGAITVDASFHRVDTESNAGTDDLDTINGAVAGQRLVLRSASGARTVVVKDGTGNLQLNGDFSLNNIQDTIELIYDNNASTWLELSRSDNGA